MSTTGTPRQGARDAVYAEAREQIAAFRFDAAVAEVFADMIARCRELGLRLATSPEHAKREFAVLLTVQTMNYLHSGRHRVAL